eukprot:CAMPEP_0118648444 /NCGR_PEP_ID=MMETSP0785-20121206/9160_1 /TAXON_ID=91992 /ORGANISM="Bolidomonas pacifica, Strain CCMP 1866" /LENGTH=175 /DNA_ID=CAMNT_0006540639 /DNA_START=63 /DNA_END=587 /DNA_ORIENTATION=-
MSGDLSSRLAELEEQVRNLQQLASNSPSDERTSRVKGPVLTSNQHDNEIIGSKLDNSEMAASLSSGEDNKIRNMAQHILTLPNHHQVGGEEGDIQANVKGNDGVGVELGVDMLIRRRNAESEAKHNYNRNSNTGNHSNPKKKGGMNNGNSMNLLSMDDSDSGDEDGNEKEDGGGS